MLRRRSRKRRQALKEQIEELKGKQLSPDEVAHEVLDRTATGPRANERLISDLVSSSFLDSDEFRAVETFISENPPALPREAKRSFNHAQLLTEIARARHMFGGTPVLTPRHLAKWLVLREQWPALGRAIALEPELLMESRGDENADERRFGGGARAARTAARRSGMSSSGWCTSSRPRSHPGKADANRGRSTEKRRSVGSIGLTMLVLAVGPALPPVDVPAIKVPPVQVPKVQVPPVQLPPVQVPDLPKVQLPPVATPAPTPPVATPAPKAPPAKPATPTSSAPETATPETAAPATTASAPTDRPRRRAVERARVRNRPAAARRDLPPGTLMATITERPDRAARPTPRRAPRRRTPRRRPASPAT